MAALQGPEPKLLSARTATAYLVYLRKPRMVAFVVAHPFTMTDLSELLTTLM